jgi:chemotaxis protein methyltransferase CheR
MVSELEVDLLLEGIFRRYGYDFRGYARASVDRRLRDALSKFHLKTISSLQERVLHDPEEFSALIQYLTVPVTEFFRDPEYYRTIREEVVPHLRTFPSLKVWVAGCSTGEEAYSLAILLEEEGLLDRTMIYATDINPTVLRKGESGVYGIEGMEKAEQCYRDAGGLRSLDDYCTMAYGAVALHPKLRKCILFTDHSLATDHVFSETHLISCRNVMIYFDRELHNRALGLFHESLVNGGFLGIGDKESLRFTDYAARFTHFVNKNRIYRKEFA